MVFEETELRLGLPVSEGGGGEVVMRKRGFIDTAAEDEGGMATVDLLLNLSCSKKEAADNAAAAAADPLSCGENKSKSCSSSSPSDPANPPAAKAQVVGWPPVRSYRRNMFAAAAAAARHKSSSKDTENEKNNSNTNNGISFVKVSMDGAPYLRKVDLKMYKSYPELSDALGKMFSSFTIGSCESQGMKDFMNESKLMDLLNSSDYVPTYEDKDGDWMLVGDVPWKMFVESCKRLRIMKGKEAIGLAPRAMEKCKNRS